MISLPELIIFDRDNTLIDDLNGYVFEIADLEWFPGALSLIDELGRLKIKIAVATNQSGVARGYFTRSDVEKFHGVMNNSSNAKGQINLFIYCPHHIEGTVPEFSISCTCRKPAPGMINDALNFFNVEPENAMLFGDSVTDIQAGQAARVESILVTPGRISEVVLAKVFPK